MGNSCCYDEDREEPEEFIKERTMTTLPKIEDMLGEEKMSELTSEVEQLAVEMYQPLLDLVVGKVGSRYTKATVTAKAKLVLVDEAGSPVISNDVSLGMVFTPAVATDAFEEAHRLIIREMFARLVKK
jgi:hypothetical protein